MNISSLRRTTTDLAIESAGRLLSPPPPALSRTWPVNDEHLRSLVFRWPLVYQWPPAFQWVEPLRSAFARRVRIEYANLAQPFPGIVMIQVLSNGTTYNVAIDYSDYPVINKEAIGTSTVYFKMQHLQEGYPYENVVPGGYVPSNTEFLHRALPLLRFLRNRLSYEHDVYGRFSLKFASEVRAKAYRLLSNQDQFRYEGSLARARYSRFLHEVTRARVCIDLPGNGDFCFRLIEYLAVGACVVGPRHHNALHVPLIDGEHMRFTHDDLSDLVEICRFYLEHDEEREMMGRNAKNFFDRYLRQDQLADYYLSNCVERVPA